MVELQEQQKSLNGKSNWAKTNEKHKQEALKKKKQEQAGPTIRLSNKQTIKPVVPAKAKTGIKQCMKKSAGNKTTCRDKPTMTDANTQTEYNFFVLSDIPGDSPFEEVEPLGNS